MAEIDTAQSTSGPDLRRVGAGVFLIVLAFVLFTLFVGGYIWFIVDSLRTGQRMEVAVTLLCVGMFVAMFVISMVMFVLAVGGTRHFVSQMGQALTHEITAQHVATQQALVESMRTTQAAMSQMQDQHRAIAQMLLSANQGASQQTLLRADPTPSPKTATGQDMIIRWNGRQLQPEMHLAHAWTYRLPDGREARGDLIEAIIEHAWDDYDSAEYADYRAYLRHKCGIQFSNAAYRTASDALEREGLLDPHGRLTTGQAEAERMIERMRVRARRG